jgi:hypothetical protein
MRQISQKTFGGAELGSILHRDAHLAAEGEHGPARGELRYDLVLEPLIETNSFFEPPPLTA